MSAENPGARPATAQAPGVRTPVAARSVYGAGLQADGYLIGERLKPGGMSEVRLGMELASGCCVVLKSVPCEDEESPELEARLAQEAEVLGRLEHPDIAKMMDFKVIAGRPRLVMELVEGVSLREFLKKQPTVEQKLALLERVARAVSHAHMRGVAHRDLKPDNVMVRADGSPVVLDFGIAALLDAAGAKLSSLTRTGLAPGTPHYMAPEQARGDSRHPAAADVYALGVLLFEMLSGSLPVEPHEQETEAVYLQRVLSEEPRNLRDVQPDLRRGRDLAAICAEALTREPGKRPSAEALAEDLRRWLELKPVRARTPSGMERAWLGVRRKPWAWIGAAAAVMALAVIALWMTHLAREREAALVHSRRTEAASIAAVAAESAGRGKVDDAVPDMVRALRLDPKNQVAGWLAGQTLLDRMPVVQVAATEFSTESEDGYYFAFGKRVFYAVRKGDGALWRGTVSPDGSRLEVAPWPSLLPGCSSAALLPDGSVVVVVFTNGALRALDAKSGAMRWECGPRVATEHTIRLSPSGRLVVQASVTTAKEGASSVLRVVALADGHVVQEVPLLEHISGRCTAVTHDDRWLVTGAVHRTWLGCTDLADGTTRDLTQELKRMRKKADPIFVLSPFPDKARVLLGGQYRGMKVACLDAESGTILWDREVLGRTRNYTVAVEDLKIAPGGEVFAVTGSEGDVMLHRTEDGSPASRLMACQVKGRELEFDGENQLVLSGQRTTIWNWQTGGRLTAPLPLNLHPVGDGLYLGTGMKDVRVWRLEGKAARFKEFKVGDGKTAFDLSADGRQGLFAAAGGRTELVDLESLTAADRSFRHDTPAETSTQRMVSRPRLAADGSRCVVWRDAQTLAIHRTAAGTAEDSFPVRCDQAVLCAALSPDGKLLALCLDNGIWELWGTTKKRLLRSFSDLCHPPPSHATDSPGKGLCMEFSPDGKRLAIGTDGWTTVSMWSMTDWSPIQPPFMCGHGVRDVSFGPDGVLWSADWQGDCQKFAAPPYLQNATPPLVSSRPPAVTLTAPASDCALSADGAWVAVAGWNGKARIYEQATLAPFGPALEHTGEVTSVDWSPDGRLLLTGSTAGEVSIWDRETGRRLFFWPQVKGVVQAAFALNGSRIVIARMDGVVLVREVYPGGRADGDLPAQLEAASGYRIGDEGQQIATKPGSQ